MIARASGALLFAYLTLAIAGVVFIFVPSQAVETLSGTPLIVLTWGLFYVIGGFLAAFCVVARKFVKNTTPLWYFEVAGISLVVAANFVFAYALANGAMASGQFNVLAAALVILAFSGGLIARSVETLRLVSVLRQYSQEA